MFIRTKDGIYEVEKLNLNKIVGNIKYEIIDNKLLKTMYGYEAHLYENEILKQADTIEELCDEFVYIKDGVVNQYLTIDFKHKREDEYCSLRNKLTANGIAEISKGISKYELENGELKFAIWTDKGLIYVAKMNDKGELVLIKRYD